MIKADRKIAGQLTSDKGKDRILESKKESWPKLALTHIDKSRY